MNEPNTRVPARDADEAKPVRFAFYTGATARFTPRTWRERYPSDPQPGQKSGAEPAE